MGRLSSAVVSQMLVVGLVIPAIPYGLSRSGDTPDPTRRGAELTSAPSDEDREAEARYLALASLTPATEAPATVEEAAVALADSLAAIPVGDMEGAASCPTDKLTISWTDPGDDYAHGAFVTPLGPAPGPDTDAVNGVVLCEGYPFAFMGFEAKRADGAWDLVAVPYLGDEDGHEPANDDADHEHEDEHAHGVDDDAPAAPEPATPRLELPAGDLGPIDAYARYEPQRICHSAAKPGTLAMSRLLLGRYPATRNLGIVRGCSIGGRSEHKEGRAFDWGAYVHRNSERQSVDDMIGRMLATDEAGNRHALARRMGVMYIIWNQRIWSAYRPEAGWRPYGGRSPHTDHAHISLSWDGAMGRTSFWNANGVEAMLAMPAVAAPAPAAQPKPVNAAPAPDGHTDDGAGVDHPERSDEERAQWHADREQRRAEYERRLREWREARERRDREREERRAAGEPIDHASEAEVAAREAEEAVREAEEAKREQHRAERRADEQAHREERQARKQEQGERRQRQREERDARKQQKREEREAHEQEQRDRREQEREERDARKQQKREEREAHEQEQRDRREQEREERDVRKQQERERRQQEREARQARKQEERERRQQEREARRAEHDDEDEDGDDEDDD